MVGRLAQSLAHLDGNLHGELLPRQRMRDHLGKLGSILHHQDLHSAKLPGRNGKELGMTHAVVGPAPPPPPASPWATCG